MLLLCLPLFGCAASRPAASTPGGPVSTVVSPAAAGYDAQERANRTRAETDARQLLTLVGLPPGAVRLSAAPAALTGPPLGSTRSATEVDLARYWRLPLPFAAADAYLKQHPPAGLSEWGSSSGGSSGAKGYAWADSSGGQLQLGLAPLDGAASYLRADAVASWLDPHPLKDDAPGRRLRIEAGGRCPATDSGIVGVRNAGSGFDTALVPPDRPRAGLVCGYGGGNGERFGLLRQRVLSAAEAARFADAARATDLGHADGTRSCPMDDGRAAVVVLEYPSRPAANLWLKLAGCSSASNGSVSATNLPDLGALNAFLGGS